jgi:hypothetical protein
MLRGSLPAASAQMRINSLPAVLRQLQPASSQRTRCRQTVAQASSAVAPPVQSAQPDPRSHTDSNGASGQLVLRFGFPKGSLQNSTQDLFARAGGVACFEWER